MSIYHTQVSFAAAVESACVRKFGLGIFDLVGDWPEARLWADGASVAEAIRWIADESGIEQFKL